MAKDKYRTPIEDMLLREMVEEDHAMIYIDALDGSYDSISPEPVKGLFDNESTVVDTGDTIPDDILDAYPDDFQI